MASGCCCHYQHQCASYLQSSDDLETRLLDLKRDLRKAEVAPLEPIEGNGKLYQRVVCQTLASMHDVDGSTCTLQQKCIWVYETLHTPVAQHLCLFIQIARSLDWVGWGQQWA
jgi:hypothetical protein